MKRALWVAALCLWLTLGTVNTAFAADTATLTIRPDKTHFNAGDEAKITYTISVAPPEGKEIGVFSFRLQPPEGMTLPAAAMDGNTRIIRIPDAGLRYDSATQEGVFLTYEYTPESNFFAAVGSREGHRMKAAADVLVITATVPAGSTGTYTLDAEFTVAPDGSGETYIGKVVTTPVTVGTPDAEADSGDDRAAPQQGTASAAGPSAGTVQADSGTLPNGTEPPEAAAPAAPDTQGSAPPGPQATAGERTELLLPIAIGAVAAVAVVFLLTRRKK